MKRVLFHRWGLDVVIVVALLLAVSVSAVLAAPIGPAPARQAPPDPLSALMIAAFLAVVANRLIEALVKPLYERLKWDTFSLLYVSWIVAGLLVALSGVNLFADYLPNPLAGQILTAVVAGGGSNFIADLFNRPKE